MRSRDGDDGEAAATSAAREAPARDLTVVLPVYREHECFANLVRLEAVLGETLAGLDWEVVVASNGVTEPAGADERKAIGAMNLRRTRYVSDRKRGRGVGVRLGLDASCAELIAIYDIDFGWAPEFIGTAVSMLREDPSLAVALGSKEHPQSTVRRPLFRVVASRLVNAYVRRRFTIPYRDTQGVRVFRRDQAESLGLVSGRFNFFSDAEFLILAHRAGLRIVELPVRVDDFRRRTTVRLAAALEFLSESRQFSSRPSDQN